MLDYHVDDSSRHFCGLRYVGEPAQEYAAEYRSEMWMFVAVDDWIDAAAHAENDQGVDEGFLAGRYRQAGGERNEADDVSANDQEKIFRNLRVENPRIRGWISGCIRRSDVDYACPI